MNTSPWRSLAWFLLVMLCLFLTIEGIRYFAKPNITSKEKVITKSLNEVASIFNKRQVNLLNKAESIASDFRAKDTLSSSMATYRVLKDYSGLWAAVLIKDGKPIVWNGFSTAILHSIKKTGNYKKQATIQKQSNTLFWLAHVSFSNPTPRDSITYHLYVAERILQKNTLKIGDKEEFSFLKNSNRRYSYPVEISFFEPRPKSVPHQALTDISGDTVGVAYAPAGHFEQLVQDWKETTNRWRSYFAVFFFAAFLVFITFWFDLKSIWQNLFIRLFFITIAWFFFDYISISTRWLPGLLTGFPSEIASSYQLLFKYGIKALFLFLLAYTIHYTFNESLKNYRSFGKPISLIGGAVMGVTAMLIVFTSFHLSLVLIDNISFSLLTLQIIPSIGVIFLYIGMGLLLWAAVLFVLALNRFIFRACRDHYKGSFFISVAAFVVGYGIISAFQDAFSFNWVFFTGLVFFLLIGFMSFIYFRRPTAVNRSSMLRNTAAVTFILAIAGTPLIYFGELNNQEETLKKIAEQYSRQKDKEAKVLVTDVLNELQGQFQSVTLDSLKTSEDYIGPIFNKTINNNLINDKLRYKVHFQLVTQQGDRIAIYSNALDVPEWVSHFDPDRFYATTLVQGINKYNVIPVIQQPVLVNKEDYKTFYRGWIPLYGLSESRPIAWIIGSVYRKRFDVNKPMQSLMASYSYVGRSEPVIIQKYENNRLVNTVFKGAGGHFPIFNQLPTAVTSHATDSLFYYSSSSKQYSYRNLIIRKSANNVLKVSAIVPDLNNILFTFFRFQLTLILAGLILLIIIQFLKTGKVELVKRNTLFQYRILDSFLLATLVFLILMVAGTYFTLNWQNKSYVKQQLYENLETVDLKVTELSALKYSDIDLQTDASFYKSQEVIKSTTPQIFRQHFLPSMLPFPVYYKLYKNKKKSVIQAVELSGQQLFIGYRLLSSSGSGSTSAMAIPAFTQSPVYKSRLLEISSFLVLLYIVIFSTFIAGAIFISRQLTQPLYKIRRGLHQISKGDLDTTIPVESKDEIGILAASYNRMTKRLKKLQKELAQREREAAWKEIAREAAHEIKNPLTPIKLNIQHLRHQASSDKVQGKKLREKIVQITQNVLVQIDALNTIAFNFLSYSRSVESDFEPVDVDQIVKQITELHKNIDSTKLQVVLDESNAVVNGVEEELHSAIFNLIKNAYEASGNGEIISVKGYRKSGDYCVVVHNKGEVIPDDMKEDIFKPNFSTKSEGTGLGLAICKRVVDQHQGSIRFESNKKEGTTFIITLPLADNPETSSD